MKIWMKIKKNNHIISICLSAIGLAIIIFYSLCDTSCSYLQGDILGVDLKYIGMGYMMSIIAFILMKQREYVRIMLAMGIGVEVYLIAFQFMEDVFCPYCMAFAVTIISLFVVNYEKPQGENSWQRKIIYGLGSVDFPLLGGRKIPLLIFAIFSYLFITLTFSGFATPAYGSEKPLMPSFGRGSHELIVFTDYFCPPCQALEHDMDPILNELLSEGGVKVSFIDVPMHKNSALYAKYFLYAVNSGGTYKDILYARKILFSLAMTNAVSTEEGLAAALKMQKVAFKPFDVTEEYPVLNKIIKKYNVRSTPTCIVRYSDSDIRRYAGAKEIQSGLSLLRSAQKAAKR